MMQARALRRAMLDPTVVSGQVGRRDEAHGHAFRAALERLDAVLAKADRLAGGAGGGEGDSRALGADDRDVGDDAFSDAATEAFLAALELQKAGEADTDEGDRKQAARTLLQLALSELEELEVNVQTWGVDIERSVTTVLGAARRGLESVSRDLGDTPVGDGVEATASSAGQSERVRVEALVASGALESALGALDSGRTEVRRVRKLLDLEARAKTILHDERERVDALSEEAKVLGLLCRPAVSQALQGCRSAAMSAERYDNRSNSLSVEKLEEFAQGYMATAGAATEARGRAEKVVALERTAVALNEQERAYLAERLEPAMAVLSQLRDRIEQLSAAAEQRRVSWETARLVAASWDLGQLAGDTLFPSTGDDLPQEPAGAVAARAVAEAMSGVETVAAEAKQSGDAGALGEEVNVSLQRVAEAEAAVAEAEMRARRRNSASATVSRAVARVQSVFHDARAAKVEQRAAVTESLALAARDTFAAFAVAADTARTSAHMSSTRGESLRDCEILLLGAARRAEESAETAVDVLSRERLVAEQLERERRDTCSKLWSAARRLEELDTDGVVGDDPEAAAMVLEARSEVVQVRQGGMLFV